MTIDQIIDSMQRDQNFMQNVAHWHTIEEKSARYTDFPSNLSSVMVKALQNHGIRQLYTHQATAIETVLKQKNCVVVTPTASGKTLCYNAPVLNDILSQPENRALYLFPTKALSQDQVHELHRLVDIIKPDVNFDIKSYTFDGDTPPAARKAIRSSGHIVVTNPDMLHSGILPHHTLWVKLFENLKYIVIDEIHHYRGIFGSHFANVIRRLKRICQFYNSKPVFICCSATIANPVELAQNVIGEAVTLVDNNGAPHGKKHFILYNPPVVNRELGIRRSYIIESQSVASLFLRHQVQTIIFARSRLRVEILLTYLKSLMRKMKKDPDLIRGYRGGYLPLQRREIEKNVRNGNIKGIVSTNALELGIDIGQLGACIMAGYAGTLASTWQQVGRAGRRSETSVAVLVASSSPLDQFLMNHPDYFFASSPESGIIDADNLVLLLSHVKCAAFELPFETNELFGSDFKNEKGVGSTSDILAFLEENRVLHKSGNTWHWMAETYPAETVSLRNASEENVVIIDTSQPQEKVIGEIDLFSAPLFVYDDAIYIHSSQQYHVDKLDWERRKAYVHQVKVDYYTDAQLKTSIKVLDIHQESSVNENRYGHGEVAVTNLATMYKKIKFNSHENIGWGKIHLPELETHTTSFWYSFAADSHRRLRIEQQELGDGLKALANVLMNVVPLYVMGDPGDIYTQAMIKAPMWQLPTVFIWERYPGGVGFSKKLFHIYRDVAEAGLTLIQNCSCKSGCPSCVGPVLEVGENGKVIARKILNLMLT